MDTFTTVYPQKDQDTEAIAFIRSRLPNLLRRKALGSNWFGLDDEDLFKEGLRNFTEGYKLRDEFIRRFGFAILDQDIVRDLSRFSPLLEIGSGTGYWAWELSRAGVDIIATDPCPTEENHYKFQKFYLPIEQIDGVTAVKKYPGRTLLMIWPDYNASWSYDALRAYNGNRVIYVGEGDGGCTGCDEFHTHLSKHFEQMHDIPLYQFFGIHDRLEIWERPLPVQGFRKMRTSAKTAL